MDLSHSPWNAVQERADRNVVFVNGTKDFTLEQVYDKLFQKSYGKWLAKERKTSRAKDDPPTYYEKIEKDKKKEVEQAQGELSRVTEELEHAGCVPGADWRSEGVGS